MTDDTESLAPEPGTHEVRLPELGENVRVATVLALLVKAGDAVAVDQPIAELETEKATAELPCPVGGTVREWRVAEGDEVQVGQVLLVLASGEAATASSAETTRSIPTQAESSQPVGVAEAEPVARPRQPVVPEVGAVRPSEEALVPAGPAARHLAHELGAPLQAVAALAAGGRVTVEHVKAWVRQRLTSIEARTAPPAPAPPSPASGAERLELPNLERFGPVERVPMTTLRRLTGQAMSRSARVVPQVTQFDQADVTGLAETRRVLEARLKAAGRPETRLALTAVVAKVTALALARFPGFNAAVDDVRNELVLRTRVHLGVAVDTPHGLLVPVVEDADRKGLADLADEIADLAARARDRKLPLDRLQGAGFTISNLGALGTTWFTPLVNWPEVAILGLGASGLQARWDGEGFVPRSLLPLSLSYDHRAVDGADAARFLRFVAEALEQPLLLGLEA